ncbi:hypothetical protein G7085_00065 [Tessaracoccus sp. HDW20]|nr:hypothetical protein [Tessaracoccus coleopterorum]
MSHSLPERLLPEADPAAWVDLADAMSELQPAERAVIVSRYVDDLSIARTAELLGRSEGWVKVTAARTLAKLRLMPQLSESHR